VKSPITNNTNKKNAGILDEILGRESFSESIMCTYIRKTKLFCSIIKYIHCIVISFQSFPTTCCELSNKDAAMEEPSTAAPKNKIECFAKTDTFYHKVSHHI